MNDMERDEVAEVRELLDKSAAGIDARVVLRLRQIRHEAVNRAGERRKSFVFPWVVGGSLAAVAATALLFVWNGTPSDSVVAKAGDDVEIVASPERIDICEDLEFYRWLARKDAQGG